MSTPDNAEATANAPTSAAAETGKKTIPPKPAKGARKPAVAKVKAGANADFKEPGSTLNPSDPNAPNYRFAPAAAADALNSDQSIDHGTGVQPPSPMINAIPAGGGAQTSESGDDWLDEITPRGRVISVSRGGDVTTTISEELPAGASDAQAAAAKERLHRRFLAA